VNYYLQKDQNIGFELFFVLLYKNVKIFFIEKKENIKCNLYLISCKLKIYVKKIYKKG
jgi:hypothetical protein